MRGGDALRMAVGIAALVAPALHVASDLAEWLQGGFSEWQLWLNYVAFLPMPWLLLGLYAVHAPRPHAAALVGALLYGSAFTYFAFTTLYALSESVPDYATLWQRTGWVYTLHGGLMVAGGLLFAGAVLRARRFPRGPVLLFLAGLIANLAFAVVPVPETAQMLGSLLRNAGLIGLGAAVLSSRQVSSGKP